MERAARPYASYAARGHAVLGRGRRRRQGRGRGRGALPARLLAGAALALALLSHAASADVVFRVPEVLVRHTAAPRAVGTGGGGGGGGAGGGGDGSGLFTLRYEEYFVEHEVSTPEARRAAAALDLSQIPAAGELEGCGSCSARERQYCVVRALHDHCCCERRAREPFPWVPHTCWAGARRCRPFAPDCAAYTRLRDCCCMRDMAQHWKGIMLGGGPRVDGAVVLVALMALAVAFAAL